MSFREPYDSRFQGGATPILWNYYDKVLAAMPKEPQTCLNVGSGIALEFEKYLHACRKGIDQIDCMDMNEPKLRERDNIIHKFILQDIEVPFNLPQPYDIVFCFEVIEHIDKTDILLENCYNNLKDNGIFMIAFPNLASLYSRIELILGFQPHVIEISNTKANFGTGIFGKMNNPYDLPIHHIRGITYRAMREMLKYYGFEIIKVYKDNKGKILLRLLPCGMASVVLFVCKK